MTQPSFRYITPNVVVAWVAHIEPKAKLELALDAYDKDHRKLNGALYVFSTFFGPDWILDRLKDTPFIRPPVRVPLDGYKTVDRIVSMAEHLVNLQEIEGFHFCLDEIRANSFETGLAKLAAAGMLRRRAIPFRFVQPTMKKGLDYDAEALIGGTRVPIEMKAKVETTQPSASSVANTLKVARGQMPRTTPNAVFMRVPGSWEESEEGRRAIHGGIEREFKSSATINVVVAHWEVWSIPQDEPATVQRHDRFAAAINPNARVKLDAVNIFMLDGAPDGQMPWGSFDDLFADQVVAKSGGKPAPRIGPIQAGRNDPCPCGSGKKFKKCHGKSF